MSNISMFMKKNKTVRENVKFVVTKSLTDEAGNPLEWEIKPLSTKDNERIRDVCTTIITTRDKGVKQIPKVDQKKYSAMMLTESVAFPDLLNAELQDSYGVKTPEDLLYEMVDDPGEYTKFMLFVQKFNGFDVSMDDLVDEVKN